MTAPTPTDPPEQPVVPAAPAPGAAPPAPPGGNPPPGYAVGPAYAPRPPEPSAQVGWAIAGMILFWPTGIPALLASQRAARALGAADIGTAQRESGTARRWGIVSVCVAGGLVVLWIFFTIAWFVLVAFAIHSHEYDGDRQYGPRWSQEMPFGGPHQTPQQPGMGG